MRFRLTKSQQQAVQRIAMRYARANRETRRSMMDILGQKFGAFGELIGMIADLFSGGTGAPRGRDIGDAVKILTEHGYRVVPPGTIPEPPVQGVRRPERSRPPAITTRTRGGVIPPLPAQPADAGEPQEPAEEWPEEVGIKVLPARIRGAYDLVPSDVEGLSPEIETPESSNVFSLQYDYEEQILYVRFKADSKPIGYREMTSICSGAKYRCAIRPHVPGPLYSYGGRGHKITPEQFASFVGAASKGQHLWKHYRVCGSTWEHQMPYTLVSTQDTYIPRKATRRGYRVRTVPTVGMGRRGGQRSTLPERIRS